MPYLRPRAITVKEVDALSKQAGKHSVGDGLILVVGTTRRGCSWTCRLRMPSGQRRDIGLGSYPEVSLAEARNRAADLRRMVRDGLDPIEERKRLRQAKVTFEEAAQLCWEAKKKSFKNGKHTDQWIQTLRTYAFPKIGRVRIADVSHSHAHDVLEPIWMEKKETARRVLQRIADVCAWAVSKDLRKAELSKKVVRDGLPPQKIKQKNFAAVSIEEAPAVYAKIKAAGSVASEALRFQILTALRPVVARTVRRHDIDLEHWLWIIPAGQMKTGQRHVVPLTEEASEIVADRIALMLDGEEVDSPYLFPSPQNKEKAISSTSCAKVLKAISPGDTMHGWRSTFRDWAAEYTSFPKEIVEACLAHDLENEVEAAYLRSSRLDERLEVMQAWADFLEGHTEVRQNLNAALRRRERAKALT